MSIVPTTNGVGAPARPRLPRAGSVRASDDSLWAAASEVLGAGQQVVLDRIDLLRAELAGDARRMAIGAGMLAGAAAFGLLGWAALSAAGAFLLYRWLPADASVALIALLNLGIAGAAAVVGVRRINAPAAVSLPAPEPEGDAHA